MHQPLRLAGLSALAAISSSLFSADPLKGANGLELTEFAREPMVRNAVAVTVDEQERVFVTSVVRRQAADLDIRRFREWIEKDVSLTSVEEKQAWFREQLTAENSAAFADRFEDRNGDGLFDFNDLALLADQVSRLEDTDDDGRADVVVKFNAAENSEITGIAAGLAVWDGVLYSTVEPDLMRLVDHDDDGIPDESKSLAHGFSVHIGYGGHNFSGAIIGPDGRLYASVADRGMNVTDLAGNRHFNPLSGAIVRCELDGSNFEIFAYGLRNVQEPAFNAYGDLIGVDNDGDFTTEKERLVYITQGSDTGWRTNWQYRGDGWLPWMDERLAFPDHAEQPAYITPPLQLYHDGPAGFAFNPGTALNPFYRDHFFMTAFPSRNLYAFKLETNGAAYRMVGEHTVAQGVLMVGVGFGPSGALYIADWSSSGYAMNENGAVWKLDDPTDASSTLRQSTAALIRQDWSQATEPQLIEHLSHPDQRVRMKAQFEMVRRENSAGLIAVATNRDAPELARLHAIWGVGQFVRSGLILTDTTIASLLTDPVSEVRAQSAKILGESPALRAAALASLRALLQDPSDRPAFFAAIALGLQKDPGSINEIIGYLERHPDDRFHRHSATMGLVGTATPAQLAAFADHGKREVRLAAIVALRRLRDPAVTAFLYDADPLVVAEAAGAIHDDESIPAALDELAALLVSDRQLHERTARRALSAAMRLRAPEFAKITATYAGAATTPTHLKLHALDLLKAWLVPANLDTVEGRYRPLEQVAIAAIAPVIEPAIVELSKSADEAIAKSAWQTASVYQIPASEEDLRTILARDTPLSETALDQLSDLAVTDLQQLAETALESNHANVRQAALRALFQVSPMIMLGRAQPFIESGAVPESRTAIVLMSNAPGNYVGSNLRGIVSLLASGEMAPELTLDAVAAAERSSDDQVQEFLQAYQEAKDATDPLSPFIETLRGGDPARGQTVFETSVAAQCTLCHRIGRQGSQVGPALTKIGEKTPRYLLESLVAPGAVVAPGYGFTSVNTHDGETVAGTLMEETETQTTLKLPTGETRVFDRAHIASRTPAMSSMPPMGALMDRFELRDLLAYLQTLK